MTIFYWSFLLTVSSLFSQFLLRIFEIWHDSRLVSLDFAQKRGKFNFFHFLYNKSYFLVLNSNFEWKMRSFEVHNVDVSWKLKLVIFSLLLQNWCQVACIDVKFLKILQKKIQKLISWVQRKGFKDGIHKFWQTWFKLGYY